MAECAWALPEKSDAAARLVFATGDRRVAMVAPTRVHKMSHFVLAGVISGREPQPAEAFLLGVDHRVRRLASRLRSPAFRPVARQFLDTVDHRQSQLWAAMC